MLLATFSERDKKCAEAAFLKTWRLPGIFITIVDGQLNLWILVFIIVYPSVESVLEDKCPFPTLSSLK